MFTSLHGYGFKKESNFNMQLVKKKNHFAKMDDF